jgi:asparagine synthase (glutamine-hydrolysing)
MLTALEHRGPDGEGWWVDPRAGKVVGLVHRRLAIIDLPCGGQPMRNEDGRVQVVFNGEIYNHAELRRELIGRGHRFATDHSDTEVLVHGWEEWGIELPERLRGMFAFGVWDFRPGSDGQARDTLFLARDRMGQKPLFYATLEDGIVFGSTIGSVLAWPEVPRRVPREQIAVYLRLGYVPPPATIWRDISQVVPGGWVRLRGEVMDGGVYWRPEATACRERNGGGGGALSGEGARRQVRECVSRAVASQLISDVPIACFLSGGIDSSIVAALMQEAASRAGGPPIQTVSVGFAEASFDETAYAEAVAKKIGSRHTRLEVRPESNVLETLGELMRASLGQPFADSSIVPTHQLSKAVREIAPVALSGDGADELFGGYDRYLAMGLLARWAGVARWMPRAVAVGAPGRRERYRRLMRAAREAQPGERYTRLMEIFPAEAVEALVGERGDWDSPGSDEGEGQSAVRMAMLRDQREYLPGDVLWKVDSASMLEALEVRSPFLDHGVVELANGLPLSELVQGGVGKWILRETFREELPEEVRGRGKKGFAVPIGEWFKGELRGPLEEMVLDGNGFVGQYLNRGAVERLVREHQGGARDHTLRLFSLLMLELWAREFHPVVE